MIYRPAGAGLGWVVEASPAFAGAWRGLPARLALVHLFRALLSSVRQYVLVYSYGYDSAGVPSWQLT